MGGPHRAVGIVPSEFLGILVTDQYFSLQGELTLEMTYGYRVQGRNDKMVRAARKASDLGASTALPSDLLVNGLPFCLYPLCTPFYV